MARTHFAVGLLTILALAGAATRAHAGDPTFDARYRHDLVRKGPLVALDWSSGPGDVWRVSGLEFVRGGEMSIVFGESTVVLGVHEKNPVWAVILPDKPASITGRISASGSMVSAVWVRFHPAKFPELFPVTRVTGPGPATAMLAARRIALQKMGGSWQADGFPAVPDPGALVLDCDTKQGPRRFLAIDDTKNSVQYMAAFEKRTFPPDTALDPATATAAFDAAWARFDAVYAKFGLRPDVDWDAAKATYRPLAEASKTTWEAGTAIALCIENLRDLHAWVKADGELCAPYQRARPLNASWSGTQAVIGTLADPSRQVAVGRTKDGIGYIGTFGLTDAGAVDAFDAALEEVGDCWALVLDVRMNGGGDETMAQKMAGRFADKKRVYAQSQYRSDPAKRTALGSPNPRTLEPRGPWRWSQPVAVLQGRRTMSSAESFAAMLATCTNVTTMGESTAGASGNPEQLDAGGGILVNVPRWNDLDPSGKPIEDVGLPPKVPFVPTPTSFTSDTDGLVSSALDRLRKQAKGVRRAGKPAKQ
ncbi:MAG: S41 family peptidase [Planctomycetota bacterium]|nr:S41 family peptidase [Planctomycetota bacterium]